MFFWKGKGQIHFFKAHHPSLLGTRNYHCRLPIMHVELEFGWWCNRTVTIRHLVIGGTSSVDKLYSQRQTGWMRIGGACKYKPCLGRMRKQDANASWDPSLLGRALMHKHFQLTLDHPPATPSDYTVAYYDDATPTSLAHVHKAYSVCMHLPIATYKYCSSCLHKCTHAHTHTHQTCRALQNAGRNLRIVNVLRRRSSQASGRTRLPCRSFAWWEPFDLTGWPMLSREWKINVQRNFD